MLSSLKHKTCLVGSNARPARFASWHLMAIDRYWDRVTRIQGKQMPISKKDAVAVLAALYNHSGTKGDRNEKSVLRDAVSLYGAKSEKNAMKAMDILLKAGIATYGEEHEGQYGLQVVGYRRADSEMTNQYLITIPQRQFRQLSFAMIRAISSVLIAYTRAKTNRETGAKYLAIDYIQKVGLTYFNNSISNSTIYRAIRLMGNHIERKQLLLPIEREDQYVQRIMREGKDLPANARVIDGIPHELGPTQTFIHDGAYGITKQPHFIENLVRADKSAIVTTDAEAWRSFEDTHYYFWAINSKGELIYKRMLRGFRPWTYHLHDQREHPIPERKHHVLVDDEHVTLLETWYNCRPVVILQGHVYNGNILQKSRELASHLKRIGVKGSNKALVLTAMRMIRGAALDGTRYSRQCVYNVNAKKLPVGVPVAKYHGKCGLYSYDKKADKFVLQKWMVDAYIQMLKEENIAGKPYDIQCDSGFTSDEAYTSCATRPINTAYDCKARPEREAPVEDEPETVLYVPEGTSFDIRKSSKEELVHTLCAFLKFIDAPHDAQSARAVADFVVDDKDIENPQLRKAVLPYKERLTMLFEQILEEKEQWLSTVRIATIPGQLTLFDSPM